MARILVGALSSMFFLRVDELHIPVDLISRSSVVTSQSSDRVAFLVAIPKQSSAASCICVCRYVLEGRTPVKSGPADFDSRILTR